MVKRQPLEERFWSKVHIKGKDDCWEWKSHIDKEGYGTFWFNKKTRRAHRIAYELSVGPIPMGNFCCHSCDNTSCVNPAHLWVGTNQENILDSIQKGRFPIGENHYKSKLTTEDIKEIRRIYEPGTKCLPKLAKMFGVTKQNIWQIVFRIHWKHIF